VARASIHTNEAELALSPGADPQPLLVAAAPRLRITRFDLATPSLEDIFISSVGSAA
jgi:ABC-type uncharacterized transport system ATPase subunit